MENNTSLMASGLPLPEAFIERMRGMLGEDFPAFCRSYGRAVLPSLRINTGKSTCEQASDLAPFMGANVAWHKYGFYYDPVTRPGKHPLHDAGLYYIQEASAMLPASLCPPHPGERVLDLCAAPGGKATQLAAALHGKGLLVANEIHPTRAGILSQNIERMGIRNAVVTNATPEELAKRFKGYFHKVVVDAPCSGEGMFRREADAVTMWSPENVALCAERQAGILDMAATMVAPGGYLTYSTCTFAPEENEGAVMAFLMRHPDFSVVASEAPAVVEAREHGLLDGGHPEWVAHADMFPTDIWAAVRNTYRVLPHHADGEGHFAALLWRSADSVAIESTTDAEKHITKKSGRDSRAGRPGMRPEEAYALFTDFARTVMDGLPSWTAGTVPCLFGDRLYLVPYDLIGHEPSNISPEAVQTLLNGLRVLRAGICAGTVTVDARGRGRFEPDHALALCADTHIAADAPSGYFPLESVSPDDGGYTAALAYLRGETLPAGDRRGWHIVSYGGLPLGWGKASDGILKNHYPKGLRRS